MSLINQMLRDLQDQKKNGTAQKQKLARPGKMERVPYLPLPVVLGGAGLIVVLMIWWLAGALSEMLFEFEPSTGQQNQQMISDSPEKEQKPRFEVLQQDQPVDQLTQEERVAEPEVEPAMVDKKTEVAQPKEPVTSLQKTVLAPAEGKPQARKTVVSKPKVVKAAVKKQPRKPLPVASQSRQVKAPQKAAPLAKKTIRLHPDDLPGAVRNAPPVAVMPTQLIGRPARVEMATPYGKAEQAYLDGLWALEQQRRELAVRSLQNALKIYPGHLQAREVLVEIFEKTGQSGEAILLLTEGLEIAPDYVDFKKRYAGLLVKQGDYDAATKVLLQNGLPGVEEDPEAHTILASLYQKLGEHFLAAQTYRNLLVAWPRTGAFWVGLGSALEGQNLQTEALDCYQRALETDNLREDLSRFAKRRLRNLR